MGDYRRLEVWQKARELTNLAYRATEEFPARERFGLTSQIRRAGVSIMANIESHFTVAADQGFLKEPAASELNQRVAQIQRMLVGLIRRLKEE